MTLPTTATRVFQFFIVALIMTTHAHADWTQSFTRRTATNGMHYRLFIPPTYAPERPCPVILFLHGKGGEGTDNEAHIYNGSTGKLTWMEHEVVIIAPQATSEDGFTDRDEVERARQVLDEVTAGYRIDPQRIYITGLSRGGNGTWRMIAMYPDTFAAAVPVCGWGDRLWQGDEKPNEPSPWAASLTRTPIWAFHGLDDEVIPAINSRHMIEQTSQAITQAQRAIDHTKLKLTLYPDVGHNSWDKAYSNPELIRWILSQCNNGK
jgi:predicted peptidase